MIRINESSKVDSCIVHSVIPDYGYKRSRGRVKRLSKKVMTCRLCEGIPLGVDWRCFPRPMKTVGLSRVLPAQSCILAREPDSSFRQRRQQPCLPLPPSISVPTPVD